MLTPNDRSSPSNNSKRAGVPVLLKEGNIIQALEDTWGIKAEQNSLSSRDNLNKPKPKIISKSNFSKSVNQNHLNSPIRNSLAIAKSNVINVSIQDKNSRASCGTINNVSNKQKYNLELFKKRTKKNSNRIVGKSGLKWSVLHGDQNYNSNLPIISKSSGV